jgi:hypothetical protein
MFRFWSDPQYRLFQHSQESCSHMLVMIAAKPNSDQSTEEQLVDEQVYEVLQDSYLD